MNRRDTILVAVLVNIGLVVVLFVCGIKPASPIELAIKNDKNKSLQNANEIVAKEEDDSSTSIDQVDQILSKYIEREEKKEVEAVAISKPEELVKHTVLAPKSKKEEGIKEVIVKQGDVLEKIAKTHKTSVEEIMRINALTSTRLQIGQILHVPSIGSIGGINSVVQSSGKEPKYYVVKNGENPWTIAIKNKIRVEELLKLNSLDETRAKRLKPGDRLRIQ